ncbi:MAG: ATP-binding protein [Gammaproteobacteria bacterium]
MKRDRYKALLEWKKASSRKPLVLRGARQVGKTYLLKEFGKNEFQNCCYINFEEDPIIHSFFDGKLEPNQLIKDLSTYFMQPINPQTTLIIFDEIQECPSALTSLKYFNEQANEYAIIAAGSLLGIKLEKNKAFPVGKVKFLDLYPLSFFEFLDAIGKSNLREYLENVSFKNPIKEPFHEQLIEILRYYIFVGGMPEAVNIYISTNDYEQVRAAQKDILDGYLLDFAKHAPTSEIMKISGVWQAIPELLAKENKKFVYSAIRESARARDYEAAIQWLIDAGLAYQAYNITKPNFPLDSYSNHHIFKLYLFDVGLLGAMCKIPINLIVRKDQLFTEFKGALTENLVAQEIKNTHHEALYYWTSSGTAEVDFIVAYEGKIYPLEIKANFSKKLKSLKVYDEKYHPLALSRATIRNLKHDGDIYNYPLYLIAKFPITS